MSNVLQRNPETVDILQSTKFRLSFERLPGLTFFCQSANLPGVALTEIVRNTPFVDLYHAGEKLVYDTFNVTFLVDEELRAWTELHDWIRGLTFPTDFREYIDLAKQSRGANFKKSFDMKPQYSDAILTIYTNKNNPNFRVKLYDVFPTSLGTILFNSTDSAENIITSDAIFRFSYYDYERI